MKIAQGFVLRNIADSYVVVPVGENLADFSAMITINETGAFIWNQLQNDTDIDSVAAAMCSEFDVDIDTARADCAEFIKILEDNKVLD